MDLLAAISSVDPPSLVAWLVFLFAAGMYPIGIMLGSSCSPCCGKAPANPCSSCVEGELPETITVTFDGLTDRTPGPDLISLGFSSCFGGGASARVTAPGGDPATDKGPISAVSLTSGGSGYAKRGRVAPTVTASGGSGSGATLTVSTTKTQDACKVDYWKVSSVSISGGTGYADGDQVTFSVAEGDTEQQAATATIHTTRNAPTLTASAYGGTGATFSVSVASKGTTPATWGVSGVTVTAGGTGYPASGFLSFKLGSGDVEQEAAQAYFYCGRSEPTVSVSVPYSAGSGASLTPTLSSTTDYGGKTYWYVSGITIADGGSGYSEYDSLGATATDGQSGWYSYLYAYVSSIDENGAITGITIYDGGEFYKSNGIIESVEFHTQWQGAYYKDDGAPTSVAVESGGIYYREDASQQPYVAAVTVSVSQTAPSTGTGASLTATVESDTASADFGKIKSVAIAAGGTGYLAWEWRNTVCCGQHWNNRPIVLKRNQCVYTHFMCGGDSVSNLPGAVSLTYLGPSRVPIINIFTEWYPSEGIQFSSRKCDTYFLGNKNVTDCSDWSDIAFAQSSGGATATVEVGGEYDATYLKPGGYSCTTCCKGNAAVPAEIAIDITDNIGSGVGGVYIRPIIGLYSNGGSILWANFWSGYALGLGVTLYSDQDGCNNCESNCRVSVTFNPFGVAGSYYNNFADAQCVSVPACNPYGTYHLCPYSDCSSGSAYDVEVGPA